MSEKETTEIDLDGKYLFVESEGYKLECLRYNEPWRVFHGDKAVHRLFSEAVRLREVNAEMYEALKLMEPLFACFSDADFQYSVGEARLAIAKAEGREE